MTVPTTLVDIIVDLYTRLAEVDRRIQNQKRTGTIHEVDAAKGLARVKLSEDPKTGKPYLSPWLPWKETAMGALRTHFPPTVGEQVEIVSESGDLTDAVIDTSIPSNAFPRVSDKADEMVLWNDGQTVVTIRKGQFLVKTPHYRVEAGKVEYQKSGGGGGAKPGAAVS